jgi:beta-glucosidase
LVDNRYGSFGGDVISILAGIKEVVSTGTSVVYEKGAEYADDAWPESEIVPVDPTSKELKKIAAAGTFFRSTLGMCCML